MISLAVIKIKVLNVIGRIDELNQVTAVLGSTRAFHPDNALSFYSDTTGFSPMNETNPYSKALTTLTDTLRMVDREGELSKIRYPEKAELPVKDWSGYTDRLFTDINAFLTKKKESEKKIGQLKTGIAKIGNFDGLDLDFDEINECKFVQFRFGSLPQDSYEKLSEYSDNPYIAFFPSKEEPPLYWGMYCAPIDQIEEVDRIFSGLYFERVSLSEYSGTIKSAIDSLAKSIQQEQEKIHEVDSAISNYFEKEKKTFLGVYTWLSEKYTYYNIRHFAARYGDSFILTGWVPADKESIVRSLLDKFETVKYAFDDAADPEVMQHSPPIQLRNKNLWKPFEFMINIYGLPSYDELDPTMLFAFTYTIFFGIMFADLGQGICVALLGWYLWKKKHSGLGGIMVPCGIASAVIGVVFGSVFGFEDALNPFYKAVFGLSNKPISVMDETTAIVYFCNRTWSFHGFAGDYDQYRRLPETRPLYEWLIRSERRGWTCVLRFRRFRCRRTGSEQMAHCFTSLRDLLYGHSTSSYDVPRSPRRTAGRKSRLETGKLGRNDYAKLL